MVRDEHGSSQGKRPSLLPHLVAYLRPYSRSLTFSFLSIIVASLSVLGLGGGLRLFVDNGFSALSSWNLGGSLLLLFAIVMVMAMGSYGRLYWVSQLSERVIGDLRKDIFSHLLKQDVHFFESMSLGEIHSRLTTDTTLLQIVLGTALPIGLRNLLIILGGLTMLMLTSPFLTGFLSFIIPLTLIPLLIYGRRVRRYSRLSQEKTAGIAARLDETFSAIFTVLAFCREAYMTELFTTQVELTYEAALQRIQARALLTACVMIFVFGGLTLLLWYGGQAVITGQMTAGQLSAFLFYALAVAGATGSLSEIHGDLLRASGAAERIVEFLACRPRLVQSPHPVTLPSPFLGCLRFSEVSFAYPSRPQHPVLDQVSFEIRRGETVALTGPSGVGKTTIFNLLLRFYDPNTGKILLNGIDLNDFDLTALRSSIGLVPQDPLLFSTTVFENIRFGKLEATETEIREAAKAAHADDFIQSLPQGYHTFLGEKGVVLSGGQRQRIAIARAILKAPPLLLLDEATSALDTESERQVQQALETLKQDRTTLIISHRTSTVQKADRSLKLHRGRLTEA